MLGHPPELSLELRGSNLRYPNIRGVRLIKSESRSAVLQAIFRDRDLVLRQTADRSRGLSVVLTPAWPSSHLRPPIQPILNPGFGNQGSGSLTGSGNTRNPAKCTKSGAAGWVGVVLVRPSSMLYRSVSGPRRRMSREEEPTSTSNVPGSATQLLLSELQ